MPRRELPFENNGYYHVFNKMIDRHRIFTYNMYADRFMKLAQYYRSTESKIRFSKLRQMSDFEQQTVWKKVGLQKNLRIKIIAYILMPNHFHFILQQKADNGVSTFLHHMIDSFTRFYNSKNHRKGPIFLTQFKSVRIVSQEQLSHTSRYIHLNPYTSNIVKNVENLVSFKYSSFQHFLSPGLSSFCEPKIILELFSKDPLVYKDFVVSHAEHQKSLGYIKDMEKVRKNGKHPF